MEEDRVVMLERATEEAVIAIKQYPYTPQVFTAYGYVGWEIFH